MSVAGSHSWHRGQMPSIAPTFAEVAIVICGLGAVIRHGCAGLAKAKDAAAIVALLCQREAPFVMSARPREGVGF